MSGANYGGRQPNNTAYIKTFFEGDLDDLWKQTVNINDKLKISVLTPTNAKDIYIPGNIYLGGKIIQTNPYTFQEVTYLETSPNLNLNLTVQELQQQVQELQNQIRELQKHIQINSAK